MSNDQVDLKLLTAALDDSQPGYLMQKAEAKALFLAGFQPRQISERLNITNPETITGWAYRDNWHILRDEILANTTKSRLQELLKSQEENVKELKSIRENAMKPILNGSLTPQRYSEAANAYLGSLDMERKLKMEALQISFINDVALVLRDEIEDPVLLAKIANKLRDVFSKYQNTNLTPAIEVEDNG